MQRRTGRGHKSYGPAPGWTLNGTVKGKIFQEMSQADVRSQHKQQSAIEQIRNPKPKLVLIRTPSHMTKATGGVHTCRT